MGGGAPAKLARQPTPILWPLVAAHGVRRNRVIFRADSVRAYIHPLSRRNGILLSLVAGAAMNTLTDQRAFFRRAPTWESVGDGREETRESTLTGVARPADGGHPSFVHSCPIR